MYLLWKSHLDINVLCINNGFLECQQETSEKILVFFIAVESKEVIYDFIQLYVFSKSCEEDIICQKTVRNTHTHTDVCTLCCCGLTSRNLLKASSLESTNQSSGLWELENWECKWETAVLVCAWAFAYVWVSVETVVKRWQILFNRLIKCWTISDLAKKQWGVEREEREKNPFKLF